MLAKTIRITRAATRGLWMLFVLSMISACARYSQPAPLAVKSGEHLHAVIATGISEDGKRVISMDTGGTILEWDSATGNQLRSTSIPHWRALSANGEVALGGLVSGLTVLNTGSGVLDRHVLQEIKPPHRMFVSGNGEVVLLIDFDGTQSLWNTETRQLLHPQLVAGYGSGFSTQYSSAFTPDGTKLLVATRQDTEVTLWDVASGRRERSVVAHPDGIRAVAFSRDGSEIATVGMDNRLKRWQVSGRLQAEYETSDLALINRVVFAPDAQTLYTGHSDGSIVIWSAAGDLLGRFDAHEGWVESLVVSMDGLLLASGGPDKKVRIWHLQSSD